MERARYANALLKGDARFKTGDLFALNKAVDCRYDVVHHQGVLEHFTLPEIRAALAQQVMLADHVVFSVPSSYYPYAGEFGNERFIPLEGWRAILEPFDVEELREYGDPQHGEREHIQAVREKGPGVREEGFGLLAA